MTKRVYFYCIIQMFIICNMSSNNLYTFKNTSNIVLIIEGCEDGLTLATAFTSLGQARNVTSAGIYYFNIDGEAFSTYVDVNGFVKVAIDFGNGSGNLPQVSALTNTSRGLLNSSILAKFTNATIARISHSGGNLDAITSNATILSRITTNSTLHGGSSDNTINNSWTGTEATAITIDATCVSPRGTALQQNVFHLCGNTSGLHWIPSISMQRIRFSRGSFRGEITATENFSLWVQAPQENIDCTVDLNLIKTVDKLVPKVGEIVIFSISITNTGNNTATGVEVTDTLPIGLSYNLANSIIPTGTTYTPGSGVWNFETKTIANGETITLQIAATVLTSNSILLNQSEITAVDQEDVDSIPNNRN